MERISVAAKASVLAFVMGLLATPCLAQSHPTAEVFGQLPGLSHPVLSPDGKHLAAVTSSNGRPVALIYDLAAPAGTAPALFPYDQGFISSVVWANNSRLLITVKSTAQADGDTSLQPWFRTASVDVSGGTPVVLLNNVASRGVNYDTSRIADLDLDDVDHVYMPLWYSLQGPLYSDTQGTGMYFDDLFQVDVNTGKGSKYMSGSGDPGEWVMDGHGHVVARVTETKLPLTDHLFLNQNNSWKEIAAYDASGDKGAGVVGLNADGTALIR